MWVHSEKKRNTKFKFDPYKCILVAERFCVFRSLCSDPQITSSSMEVASGLKRSPDCLYAFYAYVSSLPNVVTDFSKLLFF